MSPVHKTSVFKSINMSMVLLNQFTNQYRSNSLRSNTKCLNSEVVVTG